MKVQKINLSMTKSMESYANKEIEKIKAIKLSKSK
jgi:hypothetical protein